METFDLARVDAAQRRLAAIVGERFGFGVDAVFVDESDRSVPPGIPDALYVNRGDAWVRTTLYDVAEDRVLDIAWGDWLEAAEAQPRAGR